jgi:hydantoinase/carbamoylase family amidase
MEPITISPEAIAPYLGSLAPVGRMPNGEGYHRPGYSYLEQDAIYCLIEHTTNDSRGAINCYFDGARNACFEIRGVNSKFVECGSHLDTVPHGGNYDGVAGVICGLEALQTIRAMKRPLQRGLRLRIWRCEESTTFGIPYVGSRAAYGLLPQEALDRRAEFPKYTVPLYKAMKQWGVNLEAIQHNVPLIKAEEATAYLELHIEQGPILERLGKSVGLVTAIRGSRRFRIEVTGRFDHSGATPLDMRADVNRALAHMIVNLHSLLGWVPEATEKGAVLTVGRVNSDRKTNESDPRVYQNDVTKVSGFGYFDLDVRCHDLNALVSLTDRAIECIEQTGEVFEGIATKITPTGSGTTARMDSNLIERLCDACEVLGLRCELMVSGAGHDAAVVAGVGIPTAMIFIPCAGGRSHCPEEKASLADLAHGASVLATTLAAIAWA